MITALTTVMAACTYICNAQEMIMPERWTKALTHTRPIFRNDTLTICFLGDMMLHTKQIENAHRGGSEYDFSSYFFHLEDRIAEADIAVANMEFTLAGKPYTGYPCFSAPDSFAEYLAECGFDVFLAANNHIFDKGTKGAERTLEVYRKMEEEYGIRFTGLSGNEEEALGNTPLTLTRKGIRISFVNFTYGTNLGLETAWPKTSRLNNDHEVREAMSRAHDADTDFTIVLPHWGTEYRLIHSEHQESKAIMLAREGADIIIGAHPHVVQDFQTITTDVCGHTKEVPVAYSLGNAVSNMSAQDTQLELMATVKIAREPNGDLTLLPIEFTYLWCSRPGGLTDSYTVISVEEFIGSRETWTGPWEYDKMISTYERVRNNTGIR